MAKVTTVALVDDVDGSEASETVTFGIDGVQYEIDVNEDHATAIRESLAEWISNARRVAGGRGKARAARPMPNVDLVQVRAWARENGYEVSDRGRIKKEILDAFNEKVGRN